MILVTNRVKSHDGLIDKRISQAGLNYQKKLSNFLNPSLEISLVPSFLNISYESDSKHIFINTLPWKGRFFRYCRYVTDSLKLLFCTLKSKEKDIVIYNLDAHNLIFLLILSFFSHKKSYVIVADYFLHKNLFLRKLFDFVYRRMDGVLILNDNIKVNKNSQLLPGLISSSEISIPSYCKISDKKMEAIFSGSLGKTTGFELCLGALSKMDNVNLTITGKPYYYDDEGFESIISKYKDFKNINYKGLLEFSEYKRYLSKADIAFSLRDPSDLDHDFNFPSKILEYLAAGKIVISSKRYDFIPEGILYYCDYNTESLCETILKVQGLSEKEFITQQEERFNFIKDNFTESSLNLCLEKLKENS